MPRWDAEPVAKGTTTVWDDDHLLFADICSPSTVRNLRANPAIEINVVDPFGRKGYRFKGTASLHSEGETYELALKLLAERGYNATRERVKTVVIIKVEGAAPLISPAYESGRSEQEIREQWVHYFEAVNRSKLVSAATDPGFEKPDSTVTSG